MYYIFIICVLKGIQKINVVHLTDDLLEIEEKKIIKKIVMITMETKSINNAKFTRERIGLG
jgi:hypothetical protein